MDVTTQAPAARRSSPKLISAGYFAAFIALGLVAASLGPTLGGLAEQTGVALAQVSLLFTARSGGYFCGSLLSGRLYDRLPGHPVMAGMLLLLAAGMALVPPISLFWLLFGVLLIIGISEAIIDVGGNAMIVWVHGRQVGPYMNALHFFFGVGALISPIVVGLVLRFTSGIAWSYWLLALMIVPAAIWVMQMRSPDSPSRGGAGSSPVQKGDRSLLALCMLFMMLVVGAEVSFGGWISSYAVAQNLATPEVAAYLTSVFFGALTAGRLLAIPIAFRYRPRSILLADILGCMAGIGLILLLPQSQIALWSGAALFGLAMASVFPTILSWAERRMTMTGTATSLFLIGASLGAFTLPWIIGQFIETAGPQSVMLFILGDLVLLGGVFLLLMTKGGEPMPEAIEQVKPA